ncbi:isotrichodermin C-15 hydroxylase [Thozetella sp. PMI_491]|nr:isotrichodermin C-15 hydroxylase [Thozetella sp. PMI_491]
MLARAVYNVFFHPLRAFPGPLSHRMSAIPWAIAHARGVKPFHIQKLHDRYGPVARVAPNFLTFTDSRAWRDIYGHRVGAGANTPEMAKASEFFRPANTSAIHIINAPRETHGQLRRALAHGFSDKAMREQEPLIVRHVDLLLERLAEYCDDGKKALEMEKWYNWTTFDIIGDLVFAQDFGGLSRVSYDPFVKLVFSGVKELALSGAVRYLGFGFLLQPMARLGAYKNFMAILDDIGSRLKKRMAKTDERPDLIEGLLKRKEDWNLTFPQLRANSMILAVAGSETTATLLSGATYLLLTNPQHLEKLQQEVRSAFSHPSEIDIARVSTLPYLMAVLNESLRCYPPITGGLVRVVPEEGGEIAGRFVPPGTLVEVPHWAMYHSRENWTKPWEFSPERFLDKENVDNFEALQPFSYGPRNCIGRNLAIAEMRLILARIVFDFDLELAPEGRGWIEKQRSFSIWVKPALPVYLKPRQR